MTAPSKLRRARTRRRDTEPTRTALLKGAVTLAALAAVLYIATSLYNGVPLRHYGRLYVEAPRVGNLIPHDPVRVAGVRVGQVAEVGEASDGRARVRLQIEPGTRLTAGTTAAIRANGLLGARYVELVPGKGPGALNDGATVRVASDALTYGLPDALDVLDQRARAGLGTTLRELGKGTLARGAGLNAGIDRVTDAIVPFREIVAAVLARDGAVDRLVPALDRLAIPAAGARRDLADLLHAGDRALRPVISRRSDLEASFRRLPTTLDAANAGVTRGRRLLQSATRLATAANRTLPAAPAGLRAAARLLEESPTPLRRTSHLLNAARSALPTVSPALRAARPAVTRLDATLADLVPMIAQVGPYGCDIINFGLVFRSVTGFGGVGKGPNGPPMQFRLQLVPAPPGETTGTADRTGLTRREGYPAPCKFLGNRYPKLGQPARGGGR